MPHLIAIGQYIQFHLLGIFLSIVAAYAIGFAWHGPLFGKAWMKYDNLTPPKPDEMKFSMMLPGLIASGIAVFFQAAVLGRALQILELDHIGHALIIATIISLPFTGLNIMNSYAWLGKPWKLMLLDGGYYLCTMWVIAAILYATL